MSRTQNTEQQPFGASESLHYETFAINIHRPKDLLSKWKPNIDHLSSLYRVLWKEGELLHDLSNLPFTNKYYNVSINEQQVYLQSYKEKEIEGVRGGPNWLNWHWSIDHCTLSLASSYSGSGVGIVAKSVFDSGNLFFEAEFS